MKAIDEYHQSVEGTGEDQVPIVKDPNVITAIHGDDRVKVYPKLGEVVQEVIDRFQRAGRKTPAPRTRPMMEVG